MFAATDTPLVRGIGWRSAAAVVVANMIGTGIFTTTGFMARDLGSALTILATWIAGAMIALCGALAYAELGAALPEAGGEYIYLRQAFGPRDMRSNPRRGESGITRVRKAVDDSLRWEGKPWKLHRYPRVY